MLENIKELQSLRLESNNEDIDIELFSGNHILAQAKAIVNSSTDFSNVRKNLKNALESLSDGNKKVETEKLILITNSPNPLNEDASRSIFWGPARRGFKNAYSRALPSEGIFIKAPHYTEKCKKPVRGVKNSPSRPHRGIFFLLHNN